MSDQPPVDPTAVEAPARPDHEPGMAYAAVRSGLGPGPQSLGGPVDLDDRGAAAGAAPVTDPVSDGGGSVRYAWLRLSALVAVLVWLGAINPRMLIVILALVFMITLHELGHYLTAKRAGMKVTEFFLGFGPKIWSIRRGETEYGIKCIPAGAYVKIPGMVNLDEVAPEDEARTYRQKGFGSRVSVAVAGSTMHFLLALVLLYISLVFIGQPADAFSSNPASPPPVIEKVYAGSGAAEAGLEAGDRIRSIDGTTTSTSDELREAAVPHYGETVPVTFVRDGEARTADITLGAYAFTLDDGSIGASCGLGISMAQPPDETVSPAEGLVKAPQQFGQIAKISAKGLGSFFSPSGISSFGSQVGSAHEDREQAKTSEADSAKQTCKEKAAEIKQQAAGGTISSSSGGGSTGENRILSIYGLVRIGSGIGDVGSLITLFALINIFIGIFNLIPLLPFDGGHVAIAVYENIQERRLHRRRYFADVTRLLPLTYGVVVVLGLLFVSSLYLDVVNPIG